MTDITKIAEVCASRIMDRMEMCKGSAILKGDISREVEHALRELFDELLPKYEDDDKIEGVPAIFAGDRTIICETTVRGDEVKFIAEGDGVSPREIAGEALRILGSGEIAAKSADPPVMLQDGNGNMHSFSDIDEAIKYLKQNNGGASQ